MKLVTLLFLIRDDQVLLAMKKRGFGEGKWNGVGGKVDSGENIESAAIRECQEEIGVTPINPKLIGNIKFYEKLDPSFGHHAYIFVAHSWQGDPVETEEMRPKWFRINEVPYKQMWPDDELWYPIMFDGKCFEGIFTLNGDQIDSHKIKVLD